MTPLDWPLSCQDVGASGSSFERTATAEECLAVNQQLELNACHRIEASLMIDGLRRNRYRVRGRLRAQIEQLCVVSLDPVPQDIDLPVDVEFWPQEQIAPAEPGTDLDIGHFDENDPEPVVAGKLEVGRLCYELLASHIDPFPRKSGEELDRTSAEDQQPASSNPFAALAALKPEDPKD